MRFLALAPTQVMWLLAGTAAAVLILFFLKIRRRAMLVPSLILWQRLLEEQSARSLIERLRRLISLLLALAIALSIALAMARPSGAASARPVAIVLDTAPSLLARTADGRTRWAHAQDRAREIVRRHASSERFVIAGTSGASWADVGSLAEALTAIDALHPGTFEAMPVLDVPDAAAYLITDGVRVPQATDDGRPTPNVEVVSVFERAPNVAITAFEVSPSAAGGVEAAIELTSDAAAPARAELTITGAGAPPVKRTIELASGERRRERLALGAVQAGAVRALIDFPGDALDQDNSAAAYLARSGPVRVLLVTRGHEFLQAVLAAERHVKLSVITPEALGERVAEGIDVFVYDGWVPAKLPDAGVLLVAPPAAAWTSTLAAFGRAGGPLRTPRVTAALDHPVTRAVSWTDVRIDRAEKVALADNGRGVSALARSGDYPLVIAREADRRLIVTFDVRESDLPFQPSFPIFVSNAIRWLARDAPAEPRRAGVIDVAGADVRVATADGTPLATRHMMGTSVFDAPAPNVFAVDADGRREFVVVAVADPAASRINASQLEAGASRGPGMPGSSTEWWRILLTTALMLAALEWWTYQRRITV